MIRGIFHEIPCSIICSILIGFKPWTLSRFEWRKKNISTKLRYKKWNLFMFYHTNIFLTIHNAWLAILERSKQTKQYIILSSYHNKGTDCTTQSNLQWKPINLTERLFYALRLRKCCKLFCSYLTLLTLLCCFVYNFIQRWTDTNEKGK